MCRVPHPYEYDSSCNYSALMSIKHSTWGKIYVPRATDGRGLLACKFMEWLVDGPEQVLAELPEAGPAEPVSQVTAPELAQSVPDVLMRLAPTLTGTRVPVQQLLQTRDLWTHAPL